MHNVEKLLGVTTLAAAALSIGPEALANSELSKISLSYVPDISRNISIANSIPGSLNLSLVDETGGRRTVRAIPSDPREDRPASPAHFKFEGIESEFSRATSHGSTAFASEPEGNSHLKLVSTTSPQRGMSFEDVVNEKARKETTGERISGDKLHEIERFVAKLNLPKLVEEATGRTILRFGESHFTAQETDLIYQTIRAYRDGKNGLHLDKGNEVQVALFWIVLVCEKTGDHRNCFLNSSYSMGDLLANLDRGVVCQQAVEIFLGGMKSDQITDVHYMRVKMLSADGEPFHAIGRAFLRTHPDGERRPFAFDIHSASSFGFLGGQKAEVYKPEFYIQTVGGYRPFLETLVRLNYIPAAPADWGIIDPSGEPLSLPPTKEGIQLLRSIVARMPNNFDTSIDWIGLQTSRGSHTDVSGGGGRYLDFTKPQLTINAGQEVRYIFNGGNKALSKPDLHPTSIPQGAVPHIRVFILGNDGTRTPVLCLERGSWFFKRDVKRDLGDGVWMLSATIPTPGTYLFVPYLGTDTEIEHLNLHNPQGRQVITVVPDSDSNFVPSKK